MSTAPPLVDNGSFRDPSGYVFLLAGKVYRSVNPVAAEAYEFVRDRGFFDRLAERGWLIDLRECDAGALGVATIRGQRPSYILGHSRIEMLSYPYEWSFRMLQAAALHHLRIQILALQEGIALTDASAYNIQFRGVSPLHIDPLSFRPYREGEVWSGYYQFCRQFLAPLLLEHFARVPFQAWYRGAIDGLSIADLAKLLPWQVRFLSLNGLVHITLQAALERKLQSRDQVQAVQALPKARYLAALESLQQWIEGLRPMRSKTVWGDYADNHSYLPSADAEKRNFVIDFVQRTQPRQLWDFGCNSGEYSELAIKAGAGTVVALDGDVAAIDRLYQRAQEKGLPILPLLLDLAAPSPAQGWAQKERKGMQERATGDALLALALVHHLAIGRNLPLQEVVDWLLGFAPRGVVEFVPKQDPMVQKMLALRQDVFVDYDELTFKAALLRRARILEERRLSDSQRVLFSFERLPT